VHLPNPFEVPRILDCSVQPAIPCCRECVARIKDQEEHIQQERPPVNTLVIVQLSTIGSQYRIYFNKFNLNPNLNRFLC
jgi:hypothetical protein